MPMNVETYFRQLGETAAQALGPEYRFHRTTRQLRASAGEGENVIVLTGLTKYSPTISVSFYFGRNYTAAKQVERLIGRPHLAYYHAFMWSIHAHRMNGLGFDGPTEWHVDLRDPGAFDLVPEFVAAIKGVAFPFFERFRSIEAARDALAAEDSWILYTPSHSLLEVDAAMGDLSHFEEWCGRLPDKARAGATLELAHVKHVLSTTA